MRDKEKKLKYQDLHWLVTQELYTSLTTQPSESTILLMSHNTKKK